MRVLSSRAETATISTNRTLAHFRQEQARLSQHGSRVSQGGAGRGTSSESGVYIYDSILRLVSIAEGFSLNKLIDVTEAKLPRDPISALLWDAEIDRSGDSWDSRYVLWERLHGVKATDFQGRQALGSFVEARNTIIH